MLAVGQNLSGVTVSGDAAATAAGQVAAGGGDQFTARYDQFGNAMSPQPAFTWSAAATLPSGVREQRRLR